MLRVAFFDASFFTREIRGTRVVLQRKISLSDLMSVLAQFLKSGLFHSHRDSTQNDRRSAAKFFILKNTRCHKPNALLYHTLHTSQKNNNSLKSSFF